MFYRLLLRLYPGDFRRRYGDELEADFHEALHDARAAGRLARMRCYTDAIADAAVSLPREWLRTPWLPVAAAALAIASAIFYGVVMRVYLARSFYSETRPAESPAVFELMAAMVAVPLGAMLLIGLVARLLSRSAPRRRTRVRS